MTFGPGPDGGFIDWVMPPDGDDEVIPTCDLCDEQWEDGGEGEDWNGETGNHRSCEREARAEIVRLGREKGIVALAPTVIDFVVDTSALTAGDIEVIESALRDLLLNMSDGVLSSEYRGAVIATLRKVEKVLRHPAVVLVGGNVPVHTPGSYPSLRCCGGEVNLIQTGG